MRAAAGARRLARIGEPIKGERLAEAQGIPLQFLEHILLELKHARLVRRQARRQGRLLARPRPGRGDHRRRRDPRGRGAARQHPRDGSRGPALRRARRAPARRLGRGARGTCARVLENVTLAEVAGASCRGGSTRSSTIPRPGSSAEPGPRGRLHATRGRPVPRARSARMPRVFRTKFGLQRHEWRSTSGSRPSPATAWTPCTSASESTRVDRLRVRHRPARRHDRHGRRLADDPAADPRLRDLAGDRDRHRHLLRRGDEDRRRLPAPEAEAPSTRGSPSGWRSAASPRRSSASG